MGQESEGVGQKGVGVSSIGQAQSSGRSAEYSVGTVSISQNSTVLKGRNTNWQTLIKGGLPAAPRNGKVIIEGGEEIYEVRLVNSDGMMTLKYPFGRGPVENVSYVFYEDLNPVKRIDAERTSANALISASSTGRTQNKIGSAGLSGSAESDQPIWEAAKTIAYALLIALVIRAFFVQPFNIPSESMVPTLLKGDYLFVSKFPYGFSRHSFPFSPPLFMGRVMGHEPARGDVIVFKLPSDNKTDYIKRLVGLPGDRIQVTDGVLYINGAAVKRVRIDDSVLTDEYGSVRRYTRYRETLPNGVSYDTLDTNPNGEFDNTREYVVPPGYYFMMGDNRDNSMDSRATPNYQAPRSGGVGFVPFENLVGRAEFIFFSTDGSARFWEFWRWPLSTRWKRIFDRVG